MRLKKVYADALRIAAFCSLTLLLVIFFFSLWCASFAFWRTHFLTFGHISTPLIWLVVATILIQTDNARKTAFNVTKLVQTAHARREAAELIREVLTGLGFAEFLEELLTRGVILTVFRRYGIWWATVAIPIQAALWGLIHFTDPNYAEKNNGISIVAVKIQLIENTLTHNDRNKIIA